jgi:peptide methionine sulfoxide reductase MsrB
LGKYEQERSPDMTSTPYNELTPQERNIIEHKVTEPPFSGEYDNFYESGTYI